MPQSSEKAGDRLEQWPLDYCLQSKQTHCLLWIGGEHIAAYLMLVASPWAQLLSVINRHFVDMVRMFLWDRIHGGNCNAGHRDALSVWNREEAICVVIGPRDRHYT